MIIGRGTLAIFPCMKQQHGGSLPPSSPQQHNNTKSCREQGLTLYMVTGTEQSLAPCLDSEAGSTDLPGHCPWSAAPEDTAETARHHWAESHFHYYFAGFSRNQHGGGRYESWSKTTIRYCLGRVQKFYLCIISTIQVFLIDKM